MAPREKSNLGRASGDMLTAQLLALLNGWSAYGYDLVQRLESSGLGDLNKGSVYRALRQMEQMGLVYSVWDTSADGPARRMYTVTQAGIMFLKDWLAMLDAHRKGLELLLDRRPEPQTPRRTRARRPRRKEDDVGTG